jgi:hypothetical protein
MSQDHALDIVVVGLGRAGGRLAGEMARRGYRALAFHSSPRAIEEQQHVPKERCHAIYADPERRRSGGVQGCRQMISDHGRRIADVVRTEARSADLVLITAGLGGSTGSVVADFVSVLDRNVAPIVVLATLPTAGANALAKATAARAVKALTAAELDGLALVDDARLTDLESQVSILDYHDRINARIVDPIVALDSLDSREDVRAVRRLEAGRLREILTFGGVLNYTVAELDTLTAKDVSGAVLDGLYSSWVVATGVEPGTVSALQIVVEAPEHMLAVTPIRFVEELREKWKTETGGASVDVSIYSAPKGDKPRIRTLASCAAIPSRIHQLVAEAASEQRASRSKDRRPPVLDLSELDELDGGLETSFEEPAPENEATAKSEPPRRTSDIALKAPLPPASPSRVYEAPPDPGMDDEDGLPARAAFARLVTRHRGTKNEAMRKAIEKRLETDRSSVNVETRRAAVDAMARIGVQVFEAALLAATEDEDPFVRASAEQALEERDAPTRRTSAASF